MRHFPRSRLREFAVVVERRVEEGNVKLHGLQTEIDRIGREVNALGKLTCPMVARLLWSGEIALGVDPVRVVATELIEASNRNGGSVSAGAAIANGLRPIIAFAPKVGTTLRPPTVIARPIMSCSSASQAW